MRENIRCMWLNDYTYKNAIFTTLSKQIISGKLLQVVIGG